MAVTSNDIAILTVIIYGMFITMIGEFALMIFIKLGGYPIALWRIFRVPFFFIYSVQADGEIKVSPHKVSLIENNPNIADMIPHFTLNKRMYIIDRTNTGRRLGRPVWMYRPNQATNLPFLTGYRDGIISAEALNQAFHNDIVEKLRHLAETREKKRKIPIFKIMFGIIFLSMGFYIIYYGITHLAHP